MNLLELAILGLLKEGSMHGYVLKKRLDEQLGHFWRISYGSLYPALKRLSVNGAIETLSPEGEPSRRKHVYQITPTGESLFEELIESEGGNVADRDQFMLRFAFSRYMRPETRRRLLEGRRGYLQDRLAKMSSSLKRMRDRMDAYSRELMQHGMFETEHDIRWLNDLLAAEDESARATEAAQQSELHQDSAHEIPVQGRTAKRA
ncbi:MAG: PadR family transcriptional regulator [Actinomycetota bacterium]